MRRISVWAVLLGCLGVMPIGASDWVTHSGDFQRTGWQKVETKISKDTVKSLQLLWKVKLETKQRSVYSLYGPLIVERAITDRGFKEIAFVAGANNDLFGESRTQSAPVEKRSITFSSMRSGMRLMMRR